MDPSLHETGTTAITTRRFPPFKIPGNIKNGSSYHWIERKIVDVSDGHESKWPPAGSGYRRSPIEFYLCHLGQQWAERDGLQKSGIHYYIDQLPSGYAMHEMDQPGGPQVYKRLFGHPSGRYYDSAIKFAPHFLWLMSSLQGECQCIICSKKPLLSRTQSLQSVTRKPVRRRLPSEDATDEEQSMSELFQDLLVPKRTRRRGQQTSYRCPQDEQGNDDIYKDCIRALEISRDSRNITEIDLTEEDCIDWRAERKLLPQYLTQLDQQHAFVPRIGELVLWSPGWPKDQYLMLDPATMQYKLYSFRTKKFHGFPKWRGGIVATDPSGIAKANSVDFADILDTPDKPNNPCTAGFRVETMPDPNEQVDKSMSKQYRYVPLKHVRPLSHWRQLIYGSPESNRHESINFALTCMTTISLLEKWLFLGDWPHASIFCKAIYLGSELITVGDTVRICSSKELNGLACPTCTDVLVVSSIRYNLKDIHSKHITADVPTMCEESCVTFVGQAYTTDRQRAYRNDRSTNAGEIGLPRVDALAPEDIKELFRSVGAAEYGPWYPLHAPHQKLEISHEKVLGRLYEADAVSLWLGQKQLRSHDNNQKPSLSYDLDGVYAGRIYATATDERLPQPEKASDINWHITDNRAEGLAIHSLNGIELNQYHGIRDNETLRYWRNAIKTIDGRGGKIDSTKENGMVAWNDVTIADVLTITTKDSSMSISSDTMRRKGRPTGSKVIDGKVVLPGGRVDSNNSSADRSKSRKSGSRMASSAPISDGESSTIEIQPSSYQRLSTMTGSRPKGRPSNSKVLKDDLVTPDQMNELDDSLDETNELILSNQMAETALKSDSDDSDYSEGSIKQSARRKGRPQGSKSVNRKLILPSNAPSEYAGIDVGRDLD